VEVVCFKEFVMRFCRLTGAIVAILSPFVLSLDYFSILKAVTRTNGTFLPTASLTAWKFVEFPIAFIVYGETQTIPWEDDGTTKNLAAV
jgi:hypothetical protein